MKIAVLGTGMVGHALANKLVSLDHEVMMGARTKSNEKATTRAADNGGRAGDFAEASEFADIVVFATQGATLLEAARQAGPANMNGKVVIDVTNPLDTSKGFPPTLITELSNTTSAGEELQKILPGARVVKALNTMNCQIMVNPSRVPGMHDVFYCGDDAIAKDTVAEILRSFGWNDPIDLGPLAAARGTEGMMPFWLRLYGVMGNAEFNYRIVRA